MRVTRSRACWEPAVIVMSSGSATLLSSAITSQICSRIRGSPCPEPYCITCMPWSRIMRAMWSLISPRGRSLIFGIPPASETISGRLATANSARTADTLRPWARAE